MKVSFIGIPYIRGVNFVFFPKAPKKLNICSRSVLTISLRWNGLFVGSIVCWPPPHGQPPKRLDIVAQGPAWPPRELDPWHLMLDKLHIYIYVYHKPPNAKVALGRLSTPPEFLRRLQELHVGLSQKNS